MHTFASAEVEHERDLDKPMTVVIEVEDRDAAGDHLGGMAPLGYGAIEPEVDGAVGEMDRLMLVLPKAAFTLQRQGRQRTQFWPGW